MEYTEKYGVSATDLSPEPDSDSADLTGIVTNFETYLAYAEEAETKVEFSNGKMIVMSTPTDTHEQICTNIGWLFNNIFTDKDSFVCYGSNLSIFIAATGAHYRPDATILSTTPEYIAHQTGKRTVKSIVNPFAVVEVLSDSTAGYDLTEKLPNYKKSPSLAYIIFAHQDKPFVTVYFRTENPSEWLNRDFTGLDSSFNFEGHPVLLRHIYRKVIF
jgi:Uma2 family endonuclease